MIAMTTKTPPVPAAKVVRFDIRTIPKKPPAQIKIELVHGR